jgi:hypothetical protein
LEHDWAIYGFKLTRGLREESMGFGRFTAEARSRGEERGVSRRVEWMSADGEH